MIFRQLSLPAAEILLHPSWQSGLSVILYEISRSYVSIFEKLRRLQDCLRGPGGGPSLLSGNGFCAILVL